MSSQLSFLDKPGALLLHPVVLVSLFLLVLNDHFLKAMYGNVWTGKLSDFTGLIFFPILLQAGWELQQQWRGDFVGHSYRVLQVTVFLTGCVFVLIQITAWGADSYRWGLGFLQWLLVGCFFSSPLVPARHTPDVTDLFALVALLVPLWIGQTGFSNETG